MWSSCMYCVVIIYVMFMYYVVAQKGSGHECEIEIETLGMLTARPGFPQVCDSWWTWHFGMKEANWLVGYLANQIDFVLATFLLPRAPWPAAT